MSPFTLHPATKSDANQITDIYFQAFESTHINQCLMPNVPFVEQKKWRVKWFATELARGDVEFLKMVDADGKIVAFARWDYPASDSASREESSGDGDEDDGNSLPEGTNKELMGDFVAGMEAKHRVYMEGKNMFCLYMLGTRPSHTRLGLGKRLLEYGIEKAEREGAGIYLEASEQGAPLYKRMGWREMETYSPVEAGKYGLGEEERKGFTFVCMVREGES